MAKRRSPTLELLLLLQEHFGDYSWITHQQIQYSARRRNIAHANPLMKLVEHGIVEKRKAKGGKFAPSWYRLVKPVDEATEDYKNYLNGLPRVIVRDESELINRKEIL